MKRIRPGNLPRLPMFVLLIGIPISTALSVPPKRLMERRGDAAATGLMERTGAPRISSSEVAADTTSASRGNKEGGQVSSPAGFSALNVNLLSQVPLDLFPGNQADASDVWAYVSSTGREYALIGLRNGTGIVEVTDPTAPVIVKVEPDASSLWSDLEVLGDYCFNVNETGGGMQVIDLTQVDDGIVSLATSLTENDLETSHTLTVHAPSQTVFLNGSNSPTFGMIAVDVSDPLNPTIVGVWEERYAHDSFIQSYADCPTSTRSGPCDIAFVFDADSTVSVVDVTDKTNMTTITNFTRPSWIISHQGWITPDLKYMLMNDEGDETFLGFPSTLYVIDVQNLDAPFLLDTFTNGETSIDHNIMVRGDYAFQANYTTGLRIYDVSDVTNIQEVGFFDSFPPHDARVFDGAWSVNAMLPSGVVLISDMSGGLFVVDAYPAVGCQQDSHCNDHNGCTTDSCVASECQHATLSEGTPCEDNDVCTFDGLCDDAGTCVLSNYNDVPCSDDTVCGPGTCDIGAGFCVCEPCGVSEPVLPESTIVAKNRHLSFTPGNPGRLTGIRIVISDMPPAFAHLVGTEWWVGPTMRLCENSGQSQVPDSGDPPNYGCAPAPGAPARTFMSAAAQSTPEFRDWSAEGPIHVFGPAIIPGGEYLVQHILLGCFSAGVPSYSVPETVASSKWGDVVRDCTSLPCSAPEGIVTGADILSILDKFRNLVAGPLKPRTDLEPRIVDHIISVSDVTAALNAFGNDPYPFAGP